MLNTLSTLLRIKVSVSECMVDVLLCWVNPLVHVPRVIPRPSCWYFFSLFHDLPYLLHCAEVSFLYFLSIALTIEDRYITADVLALSLIASSTLYTSILSDRGSAGIQELTVSMRLSIFLPSSENCCRYWFNLWLLLFNSRILSIEVAKLQRKAMT